MTETEELDELVLRLEGVNLRIDSLDDTEDAEAQLLQLRAEREELVRDLRVLRARLNVVFAEAAAYIADSKRKKREREEKEKEEEEEKAQRMNEEDDNSL